MSHVNEDSRQSSPLQFLDGDAGSLEYKWNKAERCMRPAVGSVFTDVAFARRCFDHAIHRWIIHRKNVRVPSSQSVMVGPSPKVRTPRPISFDLSFENATS